MSEQAQDQPISEDDLARMFDAEDSASETPEPEPEPEEAPIVVPDVQPEIEAPEPEETPETPEAPEVEAPSESAMADEGQPHLEWAQRRNLGDYEAAAKLAYEQERFLGRRAGEVKEQQQQIEQLREELAQAQASTPLEPGRSEEWISQAITSPDPGRYAYELARTGDWASYEQMMQTWEGVVGESVTGYVHEQIVAALGLNGQQQPEEPAPQQVPQGAIQEAFALSGIFNMQTDPLMATVRVVADELGGDSALVQGVARGDPAAVQGLVEIARSRTLTTRTLRITDDSPRPDTQGEGQSPSRTPPKPDPFAAMDEEWRRMGVLPVQE